MSAFDYLTENAKFFLGIAIIAAFVCAGVAGMADFFGVLVP